MRIGFMTLPALISLAAAAPARADQPSKLDTVVISGPRPTSLPAQLPGTIEGISGEQMEERINATDSEDALKYLPSLNVRKRYIGDYDHAVLASRASGTGNSARSLVYADGILLSNLLGNGANFTPRWGLVSPEEIERADVLYGPFSAAYPGNSVGAVVDFQTRMPSKLEAHLKLSAFAQPFKLYRTDERYQGGQGSASAGNRQGAWSWWIDVSRLDSDGQPIGYATRTLSTASGGVPVTGAVRGKSPANKDWLTLGTSGQSHTVQDHAKLKLAYDVSPTLRASYTLGWWNNNAVREGESYLRDANGAPVVGGAVNIDGARYDLKASDFAPTIGNLQHLMQGFSLKRHAREEWDWEVAASKYDYRDDGVRTPTVPVGTVADTAPGLLTAMDGSGWRTLALRGVWRPNAEHAVDVGAQSDVARLRTHVTSNLDWAHADGGATFSIFNGYSRLQSLYAQDNWRIDPRSKLMLGARLERWSAFGGELGNAVTVKSLDERVEHSISPKAGLSFQLDQAWSLKASLGKAVRYPTAAELFQGSIVDNAIVHSNPDLRAERSWTGEWSAVREGADSVLRLTVFGESTRDALYSQPLTNLVNTVQNVGRIATRGVELAFDADDCLTRGLTVNGSLTFTDSIIRDNAAFAASVGKWQPRVPRWRGTLLASYRIGQRWTTSAGVRYSGRQFGSLDNSDTHGEAYTGVSDYKVLDLRVKVRIDRQWSAALGIDNVGNATYWAYHPYAQRSFVAELRFDL